MVFSFTDEQFLNPNLVKVIYGVAGRGKSKKVNDFFKDRNIPFLWTTSTNKLKREAAGRFQCEASTVCAALFVSENGQFYLDEKEPECRNIIIDEVLQTSVKVIDWIENHRGHYNIIVMTDTHQMLTQDGGAGFLKKFKALLNEDYVLGDEGVETLRAKGESKKMIEYLYTTVEAPGNEFLTTLYSHRFPVIKYEDMEFDFKNKYITHLNETENRLYRDLNFNSNFPPLEYLLPKGSIANKPPKNPDNYPILSQEQAEKNRARSYYQISNIGSCTRLQGSEVEEDEKLYFIITPGSKVTNREWYTVVSRCKNIDSIVIVAVTDQKKERLTTFAGLKIKDQKVLTIMNGERV